MLRRDFLKFGCAGCVLTATGIISASALLESCGIKGLTVHKVEPVNKEVTLPTTLFSDKDLLVVRVKGAAYDIAVRKMNDDTYTALQLKCTHFDNPLVAGNNGYLCNSHGSIFDATGSATNGPATKPLKAYVVRKEGMDVVISM